MHTFRKLPNASPRTKIADAKTGSTLGPLQKVSYGLLDYTAIITAALSTKVTVLADAITADHLENEGFNPVLSFGVCNCFTNRFEAGIGNRKRRAGRGGRSQFAENCHNRYI